MAKGLGASKVPGGRGDRTQVGALDGAGEPILVVTSDNGEVERVGKYEVTGILGRGGMGVVYEATDRETRAVYALKMIEARFLELAESNAEVRFRQEIDVLERLNHPGIVRLFDSAFAHHPMGYEIAFFVMEKLNGDTLDKDIKAGRTFSLTDALSIVRQLADAIDYLGKNSVLHRDIKPANIFRERTGRIVLMDFGLARSEEFTRLTLAGQIVGTFGYMSPERLTGRAFDVSADVFALGVVLYQTLAGTHPWSGNSPTEMLDAIKRGLTIPASFASLPAPSEVEALVRGMLAYKAPDRLSPNDVRNRIDKLIDLVAPLPEKTKTNNSQKRAAVAPTAAFQNEEETPSALTPLSGPMDRPRPPIAADTISNRQMASVPISMLPPQTPLNAPSWGLATGIALAFGVIGFFGGVLVGKSSGNGQPIPVQVVTPKRELGPAENVVVIERPSVKPKEQPAAFPASSFDNPGEAFAYAETLLSAERYDDAVPILERALQLNPAYADAHRLLGDAHFGAGETDQAAHHYKTYLALRPGGEDAAEVKRKLRALAQP